MRKTANGDSPLTWGSWHLRPDSLLRKLYYGGNPLGSVSDGCMSAWNASWGDTLNPRLLSLRNQMG